VSALDEAWEAEDDAVDMSVRILPGVRAMIDSLPEGKYDVGESLLSCVSTLVASASVSFPLRRVVFDLGFFLYLPSHFRSQDLRSRSHDPGRDHSSQSHHHC